MEQIKKHKTIILAALVGIILILAIVFAILTAWSWNDLNQTYYPDTTTFIGSSDVVQLGCYPENTVQSVKINKTVNTVVYSSYQSSNPALVTDIKLDKTEPRHLTQGPSKFPVYYYHDEVAIYTVKNGRIFLNFSVQKIEITDNCTLEIFMFDSYFEFTKFLNTGERSKYINHTCLTTKKMKDEFVVNFTLPSLQYTYIAGIAIGVNEMNYSTIRGSVATYNTSNYKQECTDIDGMYNKCSVKIGGSFGIFSHVELCLLVGEALKGNEDYIFVKTEITKVTAIIPIISFSMVSVCFIFGIILVILLATRCKHVRRKITSIKERDSSKPLLSNIGEAIQSAEQEKVPGAINYSIR